MGNGLAIIGQAIVSVSFLAFLLALFVLFAGSPDLMDKIIENYGSASCQQTQATE